MKTCFVCLMAAALSASVWGDVTVKRVTTMDGFGKTTTESVDRFKGTGRRGDIKVRFGNTLMNNLSGGTRSEIVLPDEDSVLDLNHAKKTYRRGTLSEWRERMEEMRKTQNPSEKAKRSEKPTHRIVKSSVKVTPTSEKKTLNGFPCERIKAEMTMEVENVETRERSTMRLVTDSWNTPSTTDLKRLREAETTHGAAVAKKMGMTLSPGEAQSWGLGMAALMGLSEDQAKNRIEEMRREFSKLKGVPIVTEVSWFGKKERQKSHPSAPAARVSNEDETPNLSGGAGGIAAGLAGKFLKKKAEASAAKSAEESRAKDAGEEPIFQSRTETLEVTTGPVDETLFQIPPGYKEEKKQ